MVWQPFPLWWFLKICSLGVSSQFSCLSGLCSVMVSAGVLLERWFIFGIEELRVWCYCGMDRNLYKGREKWVKGHLKTLETWVSSLGHMNFLKIWHFEISSEVLVAFTFTALMAVASTGLKASVVVGKSRAKRRKWMDCPAGTGAEHKVWNNWDHDPA